MLWHDMRVPIYFRRFTDSSKICKFTASHARIYSLETCVFQPYLFKISAITSVVIDRGLVGNKLTIGNQHDICKTFDMMTTRNKNCVCWMWIESDLDHRLEWMSEIASIIVSCLAMNCLRCIWMENAIIVARDDFQHTILWKDVWVCRLIKTMAECRWTVLSSTSWLLLTSDFNMLIFGNLINDGTYDHAMVVVNKLLTAFGSF